MDAERSMQLRAHLRGWIPIESRENNPTYVRLIDAVLASEELFALANEVPAPQLPANVLFASVHFMLLQGISHDLALHYPTVRLRHNLRDAPTSRLEDDFLDFTRVHRTELLDLLHHGITQTNEVARSALLSAALCDLQRDGVTEVALLDAGCSAGLNAFVEYYRITHSPSCATGPEQSAIKLAPTHRGRLPHGELPRIVHRSGLDQQPLDPSNLLDATWLEACLWPDDPARFIRLRHALSIATQYRGELHLHEGDVVKDLEKVAGTIPRGPHLVIFSSWAAAYLPAGEHEAFTRKIDEIGRHRPVTWISCEHPAIAAALGLVSSDFRTEWPGASVLTRRTCGAEPSTALLGETHPHGEWINLA